MLMEWNAYNGSKSWPILSLELMIICDRAISRSIKHRLLQTTGEIPSWPTNMGC